MFARATCRIARDCVSYGARAGAAAPRSALSRSVAGTGPCASATLAGTWGPPPHTAAAPKTYFAVPEPSWTVDTINALQHGKRGRNRPGVKLGHRLNQAESRANNLAKKHGYLVMTPTCTQSVCNKYFHFCYEDRRPYIAVNRHGDRLVVDLRPVEGRGGFHDPSRMDAVEDTLSDLLQGHWIKRVQIVNDVTKEQMMERVQAAAADGVDGSNEHKANDTDITETFHLLTRKRQESLVLARDMVKAFVAADPARLSAKQQALARAEKKAATKARWEKRMRRKLRELVADEKTFKRLPKGCLDGFIKYEAEKRPHLDWYPAVWITKPC